MALFDDVQVVVWGGGDLASGVIYRLHKAGFPVVVLELPKPLFLRRLACFGEAVYSGTITIQGVTSQLASGIAQTRRVMQQGSIPVLVDPDGESLAMLDPVVLVDTRMEKRNLGITRGDAPLVVAIGPGFTAGEDVHAVVETNRGHDLGRVIWEGGAEPDTGKPGSMKGKTHSRVLRTPVDGYVKPHAKIADLLKTGDLIAEIDGHLVIAQFDGVLRGLIHESVYVQAGTKIGDLDPRGNVRACYTISDKSLAVGGGVLEAVLSSDSVRAEIRRGYETTRGV